jgi:DNA-binding transcriptional MerR regulator
MATRKSTATDPGYSIGVVSRLTGIHPETLRMWERRYEVVKPSRSEGRSRRYSDDDVRRLSIIKTLVDAGHQISIVAPLSMAQLQKRLEATSPQALRTPTGKTSPCRIILVGSALRANLAAAKRDASELKIVAAYDDEEQIKSQDSFPEADTLVVEYATVQKETVGDVRRLLAKCGAPKAVITYRFGARQALNDLESTGATCLHAPASVAEIQSACIGGRAASGSTALPSITVQAEAIPPRQFTPQQLARISVKTPVIACECPHHLVDLISSLTAFETYSLECQNKNAEDAEIHAFLHATTAQARALIEAALRRVAEFEGIDLS